MSGDNGGNDKQRQIDGLKHEDRLIYSKLDNLQLSIDTLVRDFKDFIKPDGVCDRHRKKVGTVYTHVKVQWWFIGVIVLGLVGVAFAVLRSGGAG